MATVEDGVTKLELINELPSKSSISATDLYILQTNVQSFKLTHEDLMGNLVDNSTIEIDSSNNKLRLKDNGVTFQKFQNINNGKLVGNVGGSFGSPFEVTIDFDLASVSSAHNTIPSSKATKDYVDLQKINFAMEEGSEFINKGNVNGTIQLNNIYEYGSVSIGFTDGSGGPPNGTHDSPNGFAGWTKNNNGNITGFKWTFGSADNDEYIVWSMFGVTV